MKKNILLAVAVLVILAGIGAAAYFLKPQVPSTQNDIIGIGTTASSSNYTVTVENVSDIKALQPDLSREVKYGASVTEDVKKLVGAKIDTIRTKLKEDPLHADNWFMLGVLYHAVNDYKAAEEVWEFLLKVIDPPAVAVVMDNLGKLYKFDLKDFPKSESYFKQSIQANPASITPYVELFELYRYLYKQNTTAAVDIITEAGKKFPDNPDPYTLLGAYYRDKKDYVKARAALEIALDRARAAGNVSLIEAIGNEIADLPR